MANANNCFDRQHLNGFRRCAHITNRPDKTEVSATDASFARYFVTEVVSTYARKRHSRPLANLRRPPPPTQEKRRYESCVSTLRRHRPQRVALGGSGAKGNRFKICLGAFAQPSSTSSAPGGMVLGVKKKQPGNSARLFFAAEADAADARTADRPITALCVTPPDLGGPEVVLR